MQVKAETKVGLFVLISILIFAYMANHLGFFRFNSSAYVPYYIYFNDLGGLEKKSDVKISGVKVGWVESVNLVENGAKAKIKVMLHNKYKLYSDAQAEIHQDGFLGAKFLVLSPGNNNNLSINSGQSLNEIVKPKACMDDLLNKFEKIAVNIQDVTDSLKVALGNQSQNELKTIIQSVNDTSKKISNFCDLLIRNETNFERIVTDLKQFSNNLCPLAQDIHRATDLFEKNVSNLSLSLESSINNINCVAQKINSGEGTIAKLINDQEIYDDLKVVTGGLKQAVEFADNIGLMVDSHFENMTCKAEHYNHPDSKGYVDFRLYTQPDLFYMFQIIGSEKGSLLRTVERNKYFNQCEKELCSPQINKLSCAWNFDPFRTDKITQFRNSVKYGFQVGKLFKNVGFRFGIFENSFGAAIDFQIPFCNENFRYISSLEAFDFKGQDRIDDRSPHLKWLNRFYFLRNFYFDFGIDDFISKHNSSPFFGFGLRFSDEDLKNFLSQLTFLSGAVRPNS